jgi:enoyl-CoA hydratase
MLVGSEGVCDVRERWPANGWPNVFNEKQELKHQQRGMPMGNLVTYRREGKIAYLALNRPEKLNAMTEELIGELGSVITEFTEDKEARVAILYGEGRGFCVGMDLSPENRYMHPDAGSDRGRIESHARSFLRLWDCPKPIIAQVHGYCIAGGTLLPLCCDIVSVAEDTVLGWPKLPVGAGWVSPMWSFRIGVQRAKLMGFQVGSTMTGREAYEYGYASLLFPADTLAAQTLAIAENIAKLPSELLEIKKLSNNRVLEAQGFRTAVLAGAEWDAVAHTTGTVHTARDWIKEYGLMGAIEKFKAEGM